MEETDDVDLSMELDSKINKLKQQRRKGSRGKTGTVRKNLFANK